MKTFKVLIQWLLVIAIFICIFISFFNVYFAKNPPLLLVDIPQETKDFINRLKSQIVVFNPNPSIDDWNNNKAGEDYLKNYKSVEDENFIVFFTPNSPAEKRAKETLKIANEAINPLEQLMGTYYYPKLLNNRKLQFFVTNSRNEYNKIIGHLIHTEYNGSSTGITCFEISSMGVLTLGIVLSDKTWDKLFYGASIPQRVIWHEMNHFILLSSLDLSKIQQPFSWHIEGTAEYFANATEREPEIKRFKSKDIDLSHELKNYYDNYWVGYSVLKYIHSKYGAQKTKEYIRMTYNTPIETTIQKEFNMNIAQFDASWEMYIKQNY